jgi:short-subunit dehydrogenase
MRAPLENATVLVTGASAGIGAELARLLAPTSKCIVLTARRADRLETLAAELRRPGLEVRVEACDLADPAALEALIPRLPPIDVLINNAGMGDVALFERADWAKLDLMMRINMIALTQLTYRLLPGMLERKRGGILNISSGFGLVWVPGFTTYAATKHYVSAFSEGLRLELKGTGVVVTQVCPGPVKTEFEAVAGNPTGKEMPAFIQQSAIDCARASIAGFARGRALVTPGFWAKVLNGSGRITPFWLRRLTMGWIGGALRKQR